MWTDDIAAKVAAVDAAVWSRMLELMVLSRKTDERLIKLYHQGAIRGSVFASIGQEAIGAAAVLNSAADDLFAPCIRDLPVHLGRGYSPVDIFRQALGKTAGPTRGRDGNIHYGNPGGGVYAMISHLGAMLSVLAGGVMARRRRREKTIGFAFLGDGATSTGDFHEAMNLIAVRDIPVLVIIENNHYAYSTPTHRQYRCENLVDRALGYGVDGLLIDGNNPGEVYITMKDIVEDIRSRPRPFLLECDTMRMRGHGEHDSFAYAVPRLIQKYTRRDPIRMAVRGMKSAGLITDEVYEALEKRVEAEVREASRQALAEPGPDPATLCDGVYTDA
ncbi:MAG: thiamine pyrophosphate-dependent dehydrogenase E1 component subunit alpha [Lentisphaeria bacterium]|nr:thiamine pyrophosphate-dependent dehydrogenase E1 component subunit alpha [Lentisphaeria bacterium]